MTKFYSDLQALQQGTNIKSWKKKPFFPCSSQQAPRITGFRVGVTGLKGNITVFLSFPTFPSKKPFRDRSPSSLTFILWNLHFVFSRLSPSRIVSLFIFFRNTQMLDYRMFHKDRYVFCFHFLFSQVVFLGIGALHGWRTCVFSESGTIPMAITTMQFAEA